MNDATDLFFESATFCAIGDDKRPGFVGTPFGPTNLCNDDLTMGVDPITDAVPTDIAQGGSGSGGWYLRIMFDELLDPNVEELVEVIDPDTMLGTGQFNGSLENTQPVTVTCGGAEVMYDGYYSPSGNNVTWPVGPSLVIAPTDRTAIATGSDCTVSIKDVVVDKGGVAVPAGQRGDGGEYAFSIAPLSFAGSDPSPAEMAGMEPVIVPEAPVALVFNAFVDPTSLATTEVIITEHAMDDCSDAGTLVPEGTRAVADDGGILLLSVTDGGSPDLAWKEMTAYSITFGATGAQILDSAGGMGELPGEADFRLCFNTDAAAP